MRKLKTLLRLIRDGKYRELSYSLVFNLSPVLYKLGVGKFLLSRVAKRVDFVILGSHTVGMNAISTYFRLLNIGEITFSYENKKVFLVNLWQYFLEYINQNKKFNKVGYLQMDLHNDTSLCNLVYEALPRNLPFIVLTRDPISQLKCVVNYKSCRDNGWYTGSIAWDRQTIERQAREVFFNENVVDAKGVKGNAERTDIGHAVQCCRIVNSYCFATTLFNQLKHLMANSSRGGALFIDMQQLVGEKTPQTLKNIADFIGAEIDVELLNNSIFTQTVSSMVSRILPYYVSFTKKDGFEWEGRVGLVSNVQFINHTREAYCYTLIPRMLTTNFVANDDSSLHLIIVGKHQQKVLEYLRNNPNKLEELIDHFNIYYVSLQKRLKEMDVYNVSENDILEFFKENKEIYREFRGYIEYEVGIVRQYAPNIVQSWKYYQQFLQLHTE